MAPRHDHGLLVPLRCRVPMLGVSRRFAATISPCARAAPPVPGPESRILTTPQHP